MSGANGLHKRQNQLSTLRVGLGLASLPRHWLVTDKDRSVIGSGSAVSHKDSQGDYLISFKKRLDELCETCHSKTVFSLHVHQIFTMLSYSGLALRQRELCEQAVAGMVTEGLVITTSSGK